MATNTNHANEEDQEDDLLWLFSDCINDPISQRSSYDAAEEKEFIQKILNEGILLHVFLKLLENFGPQI